MVPVCSMNKCLPHWLNKGNFPHIYSSAVKLHRRKKEPGFGFPPLQHNHWESCRDPWRCGEPAAFQPAGARMAMCQRGRSCHGRDRTCFTHAPSDTSLTMVSCAPPGLLPKLVSSYRPEVQGIGSKYN